MLFDTFKRLLYILLIGVFSFYSFAAYAEKTSRDQCHEFLEWQEYKTFRPSPQKIEEFQSFQKMEWELIRTSANNVYASYIEGKKPFSRLSKCLSLRRDRDSIMNIIPSVFLGRSLFDLEKLEIPLLDRLLHLTRTKITRTRFFMFRFEDVQDSSNHKLAGFHRGNSSLFFDIQKISSKEWPIVLIHELLHFVDPDLERAVRVNRDLSFGEEILGDIKTEDIPAEKVEAWAWSFFHRGSLAEYRSWYWTLKIYLELRKYQKIKPVGWLDEKLGHDFSEKSIESRLIDELQKSLALGLNQKHGHIKNPLFLRALELVRKEIVSTRVSPGFKLLDGEIFFEF